MEEASGLFWGIVLKPEKRYETVVEEDFRVTKACVDHTTLESGKVASVVLEKGSDEFILCNLVNPTQLDNSLDLNFAAGEKICFRTEGGATVHLTGHLAPDDGPDEMDGMMDGSYVESGSEGEEEEEEASDSDEAEAPKLVPAQTNGKRKLENGDGEKPSKKAKKAEIKQAEDLRNKLNKGKKKADEKDEDSEEDDDEEMDSKMDDLEDEEESGEEEEGEEEEDSEDDDEDESEEAATPEVKKEETPKKEKKDKKKKDKQEGEAKKDVKKEPETPAKKEAEKPQETPKSKKKKDKKNKEANGEAKTPAKQANGDAGKKDSSPTKTPKPQKRTLKGGIVSEDIRVGNGPEAKAGKHVGMYYKGTLTKSGKQFDQCLQGKPFKFKLGKGEVIKGWDIGVEGMKVGGKRKLTIPANMGYGAQGAGPDIPPNASLTFEVECKMVN